MRKQSGTKREIFAELMEGVGAMGEHRKGKVTLRTHSLPAAEVKESPGAEFFVAVREKFNSPRTVEKWEQGGQVSPMAATFVELVSRYPDTIERLQTLPKRIARVGGSNGNTSSVATEKLRSYYRPSKINVLFVGEAPPAGDTFFYAENSQVYRYLSGALSVHLGSPSRFLETFQEHGYFLDDLALQPIVNVSATERRRILRQNTPLLARRIAEYQPQVIVTILKRIFPYVEEAKSLAGLNVPNYPVSFPGVGQQAHFRREMNEILQYLPYSGEL